VAIRLCLTLLLAVVAVTAQGLETSEDKVLSVFEMSLEEILELKVAVPAAITMMTPAETPASTTVITADDIRYTPARNLYDLIEVYVPGAIWMSFEAGPQLGIRGSIVNRNYKYLLRVNGRTLNNKGHYGAKSELEQWDLTDIQRIEIIRGPGSVTYGPGAVAGIINIVTHDADSAKGLRVAARMSPTYDSAGVTVSRSFHGEGFKLLTSASVTRSKGYAPRHFIGTNDNQPGFIGVDTLLDREPLDYFADYQGEPQVKLHLDATFHDHWRLWLRYTQQGSAWCGNEAKTDFDGRLLNQQGARDRQWTAALEHEHDIREGLSLLTMLSADSSDVERRGDKEFHSDPDHILNKEIDFSETEVFLRMLLSWQAEERVELALGAEYSWDHFGPGWGDDKDDMRLGERGMIVSSPSSNAIDPDSGGSADRNGTAVFVGSGWSTDTYSLFAEANLALRPWLKILLSGRIDKSTYSDWLLSPRLALISNIGDRQLVKLITQRSNRMNTAELAYSAFPSERLSFSMAGFWHDVEVIAWNEQWTPVGAPNPVGATMPVGDLELFGIEPEIEYRWSTGRIGASYSLINQSRWQLAPGVSSSGISFSDYNQPFRDNSDAVQLGFGNDLNNWPNQALKLFVRTVFKERLILHADARYLWDFQGLKDGLHGLERAVEGLPEEADVAESLARVRSVGAYGSDLRCNASLTYESANGLTVQVYVQNLIGKDQNKRYAYDFSGNNRASPHRVRFIEEPRAYGFRIEYRY
jgi:outer membrane receptor protein involved in Fe transport